MSLPVYMFTGFLESGKTRFIKDTLLDPGFTDQEVTLLISCEEGEEEYDIDFLKKARCKLLQLEDPSDLNPEFLQIAAEKADPDRIVIEYNGMWDIRLINQGFPKNWELYQIITTINAETYQLYLANMGSKIMEHVAGSELIVFNRCTDELKDFIHTTNIRAMNPRAYIYLEDTDGNAEDVKRTRRNALPQAVSPWSAVPMILHSSPSSAIWKTARRGSRSGLTPISLQSSATNTSARCTATARS